MLETIETTFTKSRRRLAHRWRPQPATKRVSSLQGRVVGRSGRHAGRPALGHSPSRGTYAPLGAGYVATGALAGILGAVALGIVAPLLGGSALDLRSLRARRRGHGRGLRLACWPAVAPSAARGCGLAADPGRPDRRRAAGAVRRGRRWPAGIKYIPFSGGVGLLERVACADLSLAGGRVFSACPRTRRGCTRC